ncbi:methyltransferase domain-containing protein [Actinomadura graeca]|uniref:Protein-L-isoaspartate O-methyltransferase n=1 Tax=Actinomadura graeca TaxID=2750812 RepID=A0ABX8QUK9_9ACTN|nr:methyltransferase domain-containing protein [Actinomadura graeca]QXJ22425.1 methyltransferase domain-containing protein [Actinomadura graeca]
MTFRAEETAEALDDMIVRLRDRGDLGDWADALRAVPRHLFVPDQAWCAPDDGRDGFPIDRTAKPGQWLEATYAEAAIIIQVDDGVTAPITGVGRYTSSLSAPGMALTFLRQLDPHRGNRVLEVGTGTGWTAALLAHRLGAGRVITVEIDQDVAEGAIANLANAGLPVQVLIGDGARTWPEGEVFDRVHVTCGVRDLPYA